MKLKEGEEFAWLCDEHAAQCKREGKFRGYAIRALKNADVQVECDVEGCDNRIVSFVKVSSDFWEAKE